VARFGLRVIRADADFDCSAERSKPSREAIDGHAFHATAKNFGERGLVRVAAASGLQLREFAPLDCFINSGDESALYGELRGFGGGKSHIREDVSAALVNRNLSHFFSPPH
jgi:hypothetical protein